MPRSYDLPPVHPELRADHPLAWNLGACFTMHDWSGAGGLFDLSPAGAHLTESSAVARRAGPFGPEAFFNDGSGQYLRGSAGGLSSTTSMTCSCIAMTTKSTDLPQEVWGKDSSTAGYPRWMLRFRFTTDIQFSYSTAAGYNECQTSTNIVPLGEYVHLLGTRSGTTATLYLNGRQVATASGSTNDWRAGASYLHIGYRSTTYPVPLAGAVVSARYWYDRVLTPAEILLDAEDHWDLLRPRSLRVVWSAPAGGVSPTYASAAWAMQAAYAAVTHKVAHPSATIGAQSAVAAEARKLAHPSVTVAAQSTVTAAPRKLAHVSAAIAAVSTWTASLAGVVHAVVAWAMNSAWTAGGRKLAHPSATVAAESAVTAAARKVAHPAVTISAAAGWATVSRKLARVSATIAAVAQWLVNLGQGPGGTVTMGLSTSGSAEMAVSRTGSVTMAVSRTGSVTMALAPAG